MKEVEIHISGEYCYIFIESEIFTRVLGGVSKAINKLREFNLLDLTKYKVVVANEALAQIEVLTEDQIALLLLSV